MKGLAVVGMRREDIGIITDWKEDTEKLKEAISKPETSYQIYYVKLERFVLLQNFQNQFGLNPDKDLPKIFQKACEEDKLKFVLFMYYFHIIPGYLTKEILLKGIKIWNEWGVKEIHNFRIGIDLKKIQTLSTVNDDQYLKDLEDMIEKLSKKENDRCKIYLLTAYRVLLDHKSIAIDYK